MIKRSQCQCICHTDAYMLGKITAPIHVIPCCENDICVIDDKRNFEDRMKLEELYKYEDGLRNKIWNEAIEAAAKLAEDVFELGIAEDIRKLKKDVTD